MSIKMVGFDADDTLWMSQDYFDDAQAQYETIMGRYIDLEAAGVQDHLLNIEAANIRVYGYGVKGMMLSMLESAVDITDGQIAARDIKAILDVGKSLLSHPVELLAGIEEAVDDIARDFEIVLITKGDLFHQEAKVRDSGMSDRFRRIEIVSEKDAGTYTRLFNEFEVEPSEFLMIGNSLKSDIAPILSLGGWGIHVPYHTTWAHETVKGFKAGSEARLRVANERSDLPRLTRELADIASR